MKKMFIIFIWTFYVSLMFPLTYWFGKFGIPLWSIPLSCLTALLFARNSIRGRKEIITFDKYNICLFLFVVVMYISSCTSYPIEDLGINKLFVYSLSFLLLFYVRKKWGIIFNVHQIVKFARLFVVFQVTVSVIQFLTGIPIGQVGAYFGQTQTAQIESTVGGALGIPRVVGTVGGSPNMLGRITVALAPFVFLDRLNVYNSEYIQSRHKFISVKKYSNFIRGLLDYFSSRLWLVFILIILGLTMSRSALLAFVVVWGGGWCLYKVSIGFSIKTLFRVTKIKLISRGLFIFILTVTVLVGSLIPSIRSGVSETVSVAGDRVVELAEAAVELEESGKGPVGVRLELIKYGIIMFTERPFFGYGFHNTKKISNRTANEIINWRDLRVHGAYFEYLPSFGFLGFILFVVISVYPIIASWKASHVIPSGYAYLASTVTILIVIQTGTTYDSVPVAPIYAIIWGGAMGTYDKIKNK